MKRDLKRVHAAHGIKYFAFPVIVLLLIAALVDQRLTGYLEHREQASDLQTLQESNQNTLDLDKKVQANSEQVGGSYTPVQAQLFVANDIADSVNAMQEQVRKLLQSLYFDNIDLSDFSDTPKGSVSRMSFTARFNGVPQQLPRLQVALAQSPTLLTIDKVEIKVVDDAQRGGQQLHITARFSGLHMKPLPEAAAPAAPAAARK
jgi:Tfp pilus assembly protein PilO